MAPPWVAYQNTKLLSTEWASKLSVKIDELIPERPLISAARAVILVASHLTGFDPIYIIGRSRKTRVTAIRQLAMYKMKQRFGHSSKKIGAFFGRDHTTVLHAINSCKRSGL